MENSKEENLPDVTESNNSPKQNEPYQEEEVDPRVQKFLEILNVKAVEINDLEKKIEAQRAAFQRTLNELVPQLEEIKKKRGKYIAMASPYYKALDYLYKCRRNLQAKTLLYQQAKLDHEEAKHKVSAVEESFEATGGLEMTESKQESLNRATNKVNDAEHRKDLLEAEHKKVILSCSEAENRCQILKKNLKKATKKAKPFYDLKEKCNALLNEHKRQIEKYTRAIKSCKEEYAATLLTLELLSENIHESRSKLNLAQFNEDNTENDQSANVGNYIEDLSNRLDNEFEIFNDEASVNSSTPSLASDIEQNCNIDDDPENENVADTSEINDST
ncbi:uncharacterized protein TRIADDRAFT_55099 [Trichoplax adhaerens]|uniref:SH3 domain-binding protein 5-like protein n=1 Tax=Trichoplax adhaerens TaxID=10228 RepID=B3RQS5_TRIAD|nr:hypothetical protein TRIADDRAFT_55099 [Trichoplax adhaerens]EDV26754.1 hypothetical protein TRIADDRAFT_55099 [Trichoplax adhaerens]|eukprot:XP_002110750.1 hypothetical protein TRIADDRAFT_55099 [Trichoplax adhaerens]